MARPRKDKFEEATIRFEEGTEFERVHVSVPSWLNATYIDKYGNGTSEQLVRSLHYTKDEIKKAFLEKGAKIIKMEQATISFRNFCEKCQRNGIPRIEPKPIKYDYHPRRGSPYFRKSGTQRTKVNRPDEYWLIYSHKTSPKKCRIIQFDINKFQFKSKNNIREIYKHIFPQCIKWAKRESTFLSSFQKFANAIYP